jgi:hypothetical protein
MKFLPFLLALFVQGAYGSSCPLYVQSNPKAVAAMEFLNRFQGRFSLGKCQVEILACEGWEDTIQALPIAEVLITDDKGREAYVAIAFPKEESEYFNTTTRVSERRFHYEKKDRFYEQVYGRTEVTRFEMRTEFDDKNELRKMDMGIYSTNFQLNQANGNDSEWFNCAR